MPPSLRVAEGAQAERFIPSGPLLEGVGEPSLLVLVGLGIRPCRTGLTACAEPSGPCGSCSASFFCFSPPLQLELGAPFSPLRAHRSTTGVLLLGVLCGMKRSSMLVVLGVILGEIVGDNFYKLFLAAYVPEYIAFGCIGFFSVLLAVLMGHVGDFAVKVACAFFGAYMVTCNLVKLALIPYVPGGDTASLVRMVSNG